MAILKSIHPSEAYGSQIHGYLGKRFFDITFSIIALLILSFVFLFVALAVRISSPGPILFSHLRVGASGKLFKCFKFRTMHQDAESRMSALLADPQVAEEYNETRKLKNDPRVIPVVGHFLRRSSLDEIPQFLNVLFGDMSVVGPRPITPEELPGYAKHGVDYLSVRPGITGAWQVSGRSSLTFDERVAVDANYIKNINFFGDLRIILRTVLVVARRQDAF